MTLSRPIEVVFDPATWRDPDAAMLAGMTDSPSWRVAAFQRLAMLAWSQRAADHRWRRSWDEFLDTEAHRHWDAVIAGRQWLHLSADEAVLRQRLGDEVIDECWRAAVAAAADVTGALVSGEALVQQQLGQGTPLQRPRVSDDRGFVEAARRHLRLVATSAQVDPPRLVRAYVGDPRARVSVSGVPRTFAYVTVPRGARIRAAGIDVPDGTRRVVEYDRLSGGFDRTHWTAT
jgi:hypothetical protein